MLPLNRFNDFVKHNALFNEQTSILAAVSGGMDSVLLVHFLKEAGYQFGIAHCNFQLRAAEAIRDQQFCRRLADQLQVSFHTIDFDTEAFAAEQKISIQMAARDLRYQWFRQIAAEQGYQVIALAHHQNDAIETILLNLTRGTGIAGMHGILPANGTLVRPMLFLNRDEINELVSANKLDYVEDSSNLSLKYARNKIRLEVVPVLKELNPALEKTFDENLGHFRELEQLLAKELNQVRTATFIINGDELWLPIAKVRELYPQRLLLSGLLKEYGFNISTIDDLILSLDKHPGRMFESSTHTLVVDRDNLILTGKKKFIVEVEITEATHRINYSNYLLTILHDDSPLIIKDNPMAVSVDAAKLVYPLMVRSWQQSDNFYPLGMKTRQKISDFFIHQKVPLLRKREIPLLINGNGDIIWIGGFRPDERYKVSDQTKKVTIFELIKR